MARIVVVDDNAILRRRVREVLEQDGHSVEEAGEGKKGLELIRAFKPHLVVADIFMPEMDGLELIGELREGDNAPSVLAISAGSSVLNHCMLPDARLLGANDVLAKPFDSQQLRRAVDNLLGSSREFEDS